MPDENFSNKMKELRDSGKTMVFVTHSMGQVRELCNRAVWLCDGKIKKDGSTNEVVDAYLEATR